MSEDILFREEITQSVNSIANDNEVSWGRFVLDMKDLIIEKYNNENLNHYRGVWKSKFQKIATSLKYTVTNNDEKNYWNAVTNTIRANRKGSRFDSPSDALSSSSLNSSNSSSSSVNVFISASEKARVIKKYEEIKSKDNGALLNKLVSEMYNLASKAIYVHPVHQFIFDTTDPKWKECFTKTEMNSLKAIKKKLVLNIPVELTNFFSLFEDPKIATVEDVYNLASEFKFPLGQDLDKRWVQKTLTSISELFYFHDKKLNLESYSEGNLLHKVWFFVYNLFEDNHIIAKFGEKSSISSSIARNAGRQIEAVSKRERKAMGAKIDIIYTAGDVELGACEVGKADVQKNDDKYLNDGKRKLPQTLHDMLKEQLKINPDKASELCTIGYLMMGKQMELLVMDTPFENEICRNVASSSGTFPVRENNLVVDLIPLLELAYTGKQLMKKNIEVLDNRKRRRVLID